MRNPVRKLLVLALLGSVATVAAAHRSAGATGHKSSDCPYSDAKAATAAAPKWKPAAKAPPPAAVAKSVGVPSESSFFGGSMRDLLP